MSNITKLRQALSERDTLQFPGRNDHDTYALEYIFNMLEDMARHDPELDAVIEARLFIVECDIEASKQWLPPQ